MVQLSPAAPLRIGLMFPVTGRQAWAGLECIEAAEITVALLEEYGHLAPGAVEFLRGDVNSRDSAATEATRFLAEGANVLLGTIVSDWVLPAARIAEPAGVLYWEAVAASDAIPAAGIRNFFRVNVNCAPYGRDMVEFVRDVIGPAIGKPPGELKIAIVHQPDSFCVSTMEAAIEAARDAGISISSVHQVAGTDTDLEPVLRAAAADAPDVLFAIVFGGPAPTLYDQALNLGLAPPAWLGTGAWALEQYVEALGERRHGIFAAGTPHVAAMAADRLDPAAGALLAEWRRRTAKPHSVRTAVDRDLVVIALTVLLRDVLPAAASWSLEDLRAAALAVDIPLGGTVLGYGVRFTPQGDNSRSFAAIMQWQGNRMETVYPDLIASAPPIVPTRIS